MIRPVLLNDAEAIANIYNEYVVNTDISFETAPVSVENMRARIAELSTEFPYFVYVTEKGEVEGFCYAHRWKERAAYQFVVETTVYCSIKRTGKGIGTALMKHLIDACRLSGYNALIACITGNNTPSINFHAKLGFEKVSHFKKVGVKFGRFLDVVDYELLLV